MTPEQIEELMQNWNSQHDRLLEAERQNKALREAGNRLITAYDQSRAMDYEQLLAIDEAISQVRTALLSSAPEPSLLTQQDAVLEARKQATAAPSAGSIPAGKWFAVHRHGDVLVVSNPIFDTRDAVIEARGSNPTFLGAACTDWLAPSLTTESTENDHTEKGYL